MATAGKIKVVLRLRPALAGEGPTKQQPAALPPTVVPERAVAAGCAGPTTVARLVDLGREHRHQGSSNRAQEQAAATEGGGLRYELDRVYGQETPQREIFAEQVAPLLAAASEPAALQLTVFAYGMTGSGKTHTMQGSASDPGIIPRTVDAVFARLAEQGPDAVHEVTVSFAEVYNERCYDLLADPTAAARPAAGGGGGRAELAVRVDERGAVVLAGQRREVVSSFKEFMAAYTRGGAPRSTGATAMNARSSRSHAVLTLTVSRRDQATGRVLAEGLINLIDLAGNEDGARDPQPNTS